MTASGGQGVPSGSVPGVMTSRSTGNRVVVAAGLKMEAIRGAKVGVGRLNTAE
jgi:hypothetical protein